VQEHNRQIGGVVVQEHNNNTVEVDEAVSSSKVGQITSVNDEPALKASFAQVHNKVSSSTQTVADPLAKANGPVIVWTLKKTLARKVRERRIQPMVQENEHELGPQLDLKRGRKNSVHEVGVGGEEPLPTFSSSEQQPDVSMTETATETTETATAQEDTEMSSI